MNCQICNKREAVEEHNNMNICNVCYTLIQQDKPIGTTCESCHDWIPFDEVHSAGGYKTLCARCYNQQKDRLAS